MSADSGGEPLAATVADVRAPALRRRLYYVAGFDPASPKKYHRIFAAEAARQGALTGVRYEVGELQPLGKIVSGWTVTATAPDGATAQTDYRFLHWFDLVRQAWPKEGLGLYLGAWRAYGDYARGGVFAAARRDAPVVWITALTPLVVGGLFLVLYAAAIAALSFGGADLAARFGAPLILGALPPLLLILLAVPVWRLADRLLNVGWLARGMMAVTAAARGEIPGFAARAEAFAREIASAGDDPSLDEVLVVSHSMGAQQACRAVGRAVMTDPDFGRTTPVALLTLGSLLPFYSLTARDEAYRAEMAALVEAEHIPWIDVTGPSDPGCTAALHPLTGLGLGAPEGRPVRRSPRFHKRLTRPTYRSLKRRPLDFHFQYIRASEVAGGYDVFALVAGPERLVDAVRALDAAEAQ